MAVAGVRRHISLPVPLSINDGRRRSRGWLQLRREARGDAAYDALTAMFALGGLNEKLASKGAGDQSVISGELLVIAVGARRDRAVCPACLCCRRKFCRESAYTV